MIRLSFLGLSAAVASGLFFVNLYSSLVDAPNWGSAIPSSFEAARAYFSVANPGTFFRIVSPLNQILALLVVIMCWKTNRYLALSMLVLTILLDVFTFSYFYPRNEIMFIAPLNASAAKVAWQEWSSMNWLRTAMCAGNVVLAFVLVVKTAIKSTL
jgi:hypothetical protein